MSYQSTTPNFDLPQWQETDSFQMDDFNEAFSNIDSDVQKKITATGLLKGDGNGGVTTAVANTDYATTRLATAAYSGLMGTAQFTKLNVIDDYVIDQGTSGIWTYRKWNSGIKECWGSQTFSNVNINTAFGGTFYSGNFGNINFPSGLFTQTPKVFSDVLEGTYGCWLMRGSDHPSAAQTGSQNAVRGTAVNIPSVTLAYYAVGR